MAKKHKTHKGAIKRLRLKKSGRVTRNSRRNRKQRFARNTESKDKNTDRKKLVLDSVEEKRLSPFLRK